MSASGLTMIFDRLPSSRPTSAHAIDPRPQLSVTGELHSDRSSVLFPRQFLSVGGRQTGAARKSRAGHPDRLA